ncbi:MAG: PspC domain-containing protein [bacterium]|nr:PspC domain-containing protein [bacterium]
MKRLTKSYDKKVLAGICGGLGEYYDIDPVVVRIVAVLTTFMLGGLPVIAYIVGILVIPFDGGERPGTLTSANKERMKEHVKILGVLYVVFSVIGFILAFVLFSLIKGGGLISGDSEAIAITSFIASVITGLIVLLATPGLLGGMGLLNYNSWSRVLVMVLGFINLIIIPPFSTALGIYTIWTLTNKNTEALFNEDE